MQAARKSSQTTQKKQSTNLALLDASIGGRNFNFLWIFLSEKVIKSRLAILWTVSLKKLK